MRTNRLPNYVHCTKFYKRWGNTHHSHAGMILKRIMQCQESNKYKEQVTWRKQISIFNCVGVNHNSIQLGIFCGKWNCWAEIRPCLPRNNEICFINGSYPLFVFMSSWLCRPESWNHNNWGKAKVIIMASTWRPNNNEGRSLTSLENDTPHMHPELFGFTFLMIFILTFCYEGLQWWIWLRANQTIAPIPTALPQIIDTITLKGLEMKPTSSFDPYYPCITDFVMEFE